MQSGKPSALRFELELIISPSGSGGATASSTSSLPIVCTELLETLESLESACSREGLLELSFHPSNRSLTNARQRTKDPKLIYKDRYCGEKEVVRKAPAEIVQWPSNPFFYNFEILSGLPPHRTHFVNPKPSMPKACENIFLNVLGGYFLSRNSANVNSNRLRQYRRRQLILPDIASSVTSSSPQGRFVFVFRLRLRDFNSTMSVIFLNATIIDGTGNVPRYVGSVSVRDGRIDTIREGPDPYASSDLNLAKEENTRIIDCENGRWALSPGFIDMHAHSDLSLLHTPTHEAKITQGVTTEVIGQDGISYSPVSDRSIARIREQISGWNGNPSDPPDFFDRWRTVGEYLHVLDRERIATNAAYLVPQGNLRILVKGWDSSPATQDEIDAMKVLLANSLEEGAVGMSSGLTYVPGMFAPDDEIAQLCEVVVKYGGYYCPHTRSYGKGALQAYAEMIELAKRTGVRQTDE